MADADKEARMAAVRKKALELKKKKAKSTKKGDASDAGAEAGDAPITGSADENAEEQPATAGDENAGTNEDEHENVEEGADATVSEDRPPSPSASPAPGSSLAEQSKMRSTSFRMASAPGPGLASPGPLSPEGGETAADIYRKQVSRIEELEKENKRLAKEAGDATKRWTKVEEELAELREAEKEGAEGGGGGEVDTLRDQVAALERQNTQLQQQISRTTGRHGSSPSISVNTPGAELEAQLAAKSVTIETMELELSRLRAHAEKGTSAEKEQIAALEEKLARAESAAGAAQRELADVKKAMDQSARKAVQDSSEKTSAETKIRTLEQEATEARRERDDMAVKVEGLEKKVATLTTLHREQDGRMNALRREKETAEAELAKAKSRKSVEGGGGLDDEGVDELENEVRLRLEKRVRDLESEVHELRRGVWRDKRRELDVTSPSGGVFENVDLGVSSPGGMGGAHRRNPTMSGGIGGFLASGLNALAGGGGEDEGLLDDDDDFDEDAFRKAQEEMMMKRVERVREVKRGLKNWEGWRVDLVGIGGLGVGEIFEV